MLCAKNLLKAALAAVIVVAVGTAHAQFRVEVAERRSGDHTPLALGVESLHSASVAASKGQRNPVPVAVNAGPDMAAQSYIVATEFSYAAAATSTFYVRFELLAGDERDSNQIRFSAPHPTINLSGTNVQGSQTLRFASVDSNRTWLVLSHTLGASNIMNQGRGIGGPNGLTLVAEVRTRGGLEIHAPTMSEVTYRVRMSIWDSQSDASNDNGTPLWEATGDVALSKRTLSSSVAPLPEETASVAHNFRKFVEAPNHVGNFANVTVIATSTAVYGTGAQKQTLTIKNHATGATAAAADALERVEVTVTGSNKQASYNFGNFFLGATTCATPGDAMTREVPENTPAADQVGATTSLTKNILPAAAVGTHLFCANVTANTDEQKTETFKRIEPVSYTMTVKHKIKNVTATMTFADEVKAGSIGRDGTVVRLGFLTTASDFGAGRAVWEGWQGGSYNQRLIISNHGTVDAEYTLGDFASEEGVTVEAKDAAEGTVKAGTSMVMPVRDMITIMEGARTSAKLTINAVEANVTVTTSQVTLPEGQTDTVRHHPR